MTSHGHGTGVGPQRSSCSLYATSLRLLTTAFDGGLRQQKFSWADATNLIGDAITTVRTSAAVLYPDNEED